MHRSGRDRGIRPTPTVLCAGAVALLIMGDSFLYSALPVSAPDLHLSLFQVSVLLSANRWVRLASNTVVALLVPRLPPRWFFVGAAVLGMASTAAFVRQPAFGAMVLARIVWGLAWSVFRQAAYLAVWQEPRERQGRQLGYWWGIVRVGSGVGVLLGGIVLDLHGFTAAFWVLSGLAVLGVGLAAVIRWPAEAVPFEDDVAFGLRRTWLTVSRNAPLRWLLFLGAGTRLAITVSIALMSLYLQTRMTLSEGWTGIGFSAGLVLSAHWMSLFLAGPVVGWLADRIGRLRTLMLVAGTTAVSLACAAFAHGPWAVAVGVGVMLGFSGLRMAVEVAMADRTRALPDAHLIMGGYASLDDLAGAVGPILSLTWFQPSLIPPLFSGCAAVLLLLSIGYARSSRERSAANP